MAHVLGLIISITGIIFASIGVIGESRLKNLENLLRVKSRVNIFDFFRSLKETTQNFAWKILAILLVFAASLFFLNLFPSLETLVHVILAVMILLIYTGFIFFPLLMLTFFIFVVIISLPYRVLDKIVEKTKLQSTLVLLGIILSVTGLLLLETT